MTRVKHPTNSFDQVKRAYLTFKHEVYAQRHNLRLRQRVAEFETEGGLRVKLLAIHEVAQSHIPVEHPAMRNWLDEISAVVLPKSISLPTLKNKSPSGKGARLNRFFTNKMTADLYETEKVNYFFDGPIELHVLSVLWLLEEGRYLDAELSDNCIGMRLHDRVQKNESVIHRLFKPYPKQYAAWRDGAIQCAQRLLKKEKQDVCILSLDFESFFYRLSPNFKEMGNFIEKARSRDRNGTKSIFGPLLPIIETICTQYREVTRACQDITHPNLPQNAGIPIEILFSPVLANWALRDFDSMIAEKINPYYYARYVDDLLLVLPVHGVDKDDPLAGVMRKQFEERHLLSKRGEAYYLTMCKDIRLQKEKCLLHHFDAKNSVAGLDNFAKRISKLSSEFRELPESGFETPFKEVAWDLLYDGSEFKWRSVTGIGEDKNELAKFLNKRCILALFTDTDHALEAADDLVTFFKGRNCLEYHDLWERLFTLLALAEEADIAEAIERNIEEAIGVLQFKAKDNSAVSEEINHRLQNSLKHHLVLCLAMAHAAAGFEGSKTETIRNTATQFGGALLARHYFKRDLTDKDNGSSTFSVEDLIDLPSLVGRLTQPTRKFDIWLATKLSSQTQSALAAYQAASTNPARLKKALQQELNKLVKDESIYEQERFTGITLRSEVETLLSQGPRGIDLHHLNRLLVEDAYPLELSRNRDNPVGISFHDWSDRSQMLGQKPDVFPRFFPIEELLVEALQKCEGAVNAESVFRRVKEKYRQYNGLPLTGIEVTVEEVEQ